MLFDVITQFVMGDDDGFGLTAIGMRGHSEHQDVCGRSNVSLSIDKASTSFIIHRQLQDSRGHVADAGDYSSFIDLYAGEQGIGRPMLRAEINHHARPEERAAVQARPWRQRQRVVIRNTRADWTGVWFRNKVRQRRERGSKARCRPLKR
jgi:hypothetical protein